MLNVLNMNEEAFPMGQERPRLVNHRKEQAPEMTDLSPLRPVWQLRQRGCPVEICHFKVQQILLSSHKHQKSRQLPASLKRSPFMIKPHVRHMKTS